MESYEDLESKIIGTGRCTVCGACVSACPLYYIQLIDGMPKRPRKKAACRECGVCFNACHRTSPRIKSSEVLGGFIRVVSASKKNDTERNACQDGGVVTAVLKYALGEGIIDGAIVTGQEGWKPLPLIIKSVGDLIRSAKTKYGNSPLLAKIRPAIIEHNMSKLGVVGLPCHICSVQNLRVNKIEPLDSSIALTVGLFCTKNFEYSSVEDKITNLGIRMDEVQKFTVHDNFLNIHTAKKIEQIPLSDTHGWAPAYCPCSDYSSELADISVGSGSTRETSTVIVRTEKGDRIIRGLEKSGIITVIPVQDISFLVRDSERKRKSAKL